MKKYFKLFNVIVLLVIYNENNIIKYKLFGFLTILKVTNKNNIKRYKLLGFLPLLKVKKSIKNQQKPRCNTIQDNAKSKNYFQENSISNHIRYAFDKRKAYVYNLPDDIQLPIRNFKISILFFIATHPDNEKRGIGLYIESLISTISKDSRFEITVLIPQDDTFYNLRKIKNIFIEDKIEDLTKQYDFLVFDDIQTTAVLNSLNSISLMEKVKMTSGISYDLIPFLYRDNYNPLESTKCLQGIWSINHIFSISQHTKNDLIKHLEIPNNKITNIMGAPNYKFPLPNKNISYDVNKRNNDIVYCAGADRRKNADGIAKAFAIAYQSGNLPKDARLVFTSYFAGGDYFIELIKNAISPYHNIKMEEQVVYFKKRISDDEVINMTKSARAAIFGSFYEGLGMPILEAYSVGTPCISSNTSSMKEITHPDCIFDVYDNNDIAKKIIEIYNSPELCQKSIEFGKKLLMEQCNWGMVVEKLFNKLQELKNSNDFFQKDMDKILQLQNSREKEDKIAVYCGGNGAIAQVTVKIHSTMPNEYDLLADMHNVNDYKILHSFLSKGNNLFPAQYSSYTRKLFVLGNSPHNINALREAIRTKGEIGRWIILHEPILNALFEEFMNGDMKKLVSEYYPHLRTNFDHNYHFYLKNKALMLKPLIEITGIKNIITITEKNRLLALAELQNEGINDINIELIPVLPFEKIIGVPKHKLSEKPEQFIIGTFGWPSPLKCTSEIVKATEILNKQGMNIKCLLAGMNVLEYCQHHKLISDNVIIIDSPENKEYLEYMNSVDLGVQLRPNAHSNSSGYLAELIGLGIPTLINDGFVEKDLEPYFHFVPEDVSVKDLAEKIRKILLSETKIMSVTDTLFDKYSYKSAAEHINKIMKKREIETGFPEN